MERACRFGNCFYSKAILKLTLLASIFIFPSSGNAADVDLEKNLQKSLGQGGALIQTIEQKLLSGSPVTTELSQLKNLSEDIKASNLLLQERFRLREEKVKALGSKAVDRQQEMAEGYRKALEEYLSLIESLPAASGQESAVRTQKKIEKLKAILDKILPKKKRPIIGSLPYKHLNYPAVEPSTAPEITPAYKGGNKAVTPDDTKSTPEAPISKTIAEFAQSFNWQPVAEYEYVKNSIETEWYWGCQKGAEETLRQKSGNDCDQALLLASLLKASGFPTRIVRGNIQFFASDGKPIERVKNLIGIDDPLKIAEFFQKAGIPFKPVIAGGKITNFEISHIWVESQIPYSNYRGNVIDEHGKVWLGLDTSIKTTDFVYNNAKDIFEESGVGSQLSGIRDVYLGLTPNSQLSVTQLATPLEYLQSRINSELTAQNSQLTYNDFLRTKTLTPEPMKFLPASLQFQLIKATNEYTQIPDELVHKVKLSAFSGQPSANNDKLFDITLPLYKLNNQQIAITYEPETVEDQEIIDSYGGLGSTPAYLVRLRPVLEINGERTVVANDGLPMGAEYTLTVEVIGASGVQSSGKTTNTQVIGNQIVIGIVGQKTNTAALTTDQSGKDAKQLMFEETQRYIDRWNQAEDELASLLHLTIARPLPTITVIGGLIDVAYLLDMPHEITWKGLFVDAAFRRIETVSGPLTAANSERIKLFMQLSSLQGSILENRILEDDFQVEGISTAKLFQLATSNTGSTTSILSIDKTNIDAMLPTLTIDDNIKEDITNAVNQNLTIRIPQSDMAYKDWTGTGYLKENPSTGESGWMLTGMIAGSMNALSPEQWVNMYLIAVFTNPLAVAPNVDPLSAASIRKIPSTDEQRGTVDR